MLVNALMTDCQVGLNGYLTMRNNTNPDGQADKSETRKQGKLKTTGNIEAATYLQGIMFRNS